MNYQWKAVADKYVTKEVLYVGAVCVGCVRDEARSTQPTGRKQSAPFTTSCSLPVNVGNGHTNTTNIGKADTMAAGKALLLAKVEDWFNKAMGE